MADGRIISVLIADDHGVLRDGLRCLLAGHGDFRVLNAVPDGAEAVREARRALPDVALLDIALPKMNGIEAARSIARESPRTGMLIMNLPASSSLVPRAYAAGARGVLYPECGAQELVAAMRTVARGDHFRPARPRPRAGRPPASAPTIGLPLTPMETEIVRLVASGASNADIARLLHLSRRTVETYRLRLMRKLGLDNVPALVKFAILHGIALLE